MKAKIGKIIASTSDIPLSMSVKGMEFMNRNSAAIGIGFIGFSIISLSAEAANNNNTIVSSATKSMATFLKEDARNVIDLGLIGSGGAMSLIRGSWTPVVAGGLALGIFEILMGVVKISN